MLVVALATPWPTTVCTIAMLLLTALNAIGSWWLTAGKEQRTSTEIGQLFPYYYGLGVAALVLGAAFRAGLDADLAMSALAGIFVCAGCRKMVAQSACRPS